MIVPARDEERVIGSTVEAMLQQDYTGIEIIVVDDHSSDRTPAILAQLAAVDGRLKVVRGEQTPPGWLGKPWALEQGARASSGDLLLFVDADVRYEPDAVSALVAARATWKADMLTVFPSIVMRSFWEHIGLTQLAMAAFVYLPTFLAHKSRTPLLALGGGPGNLVTREAYEKIGRHEALRAAVIDDIGLARLLRREGFRTVAVGGREVVSLRMYHGLREVVDGFSKNVYTAFGGTLFTAAIGAVGMLLFHLGPYVGAAWGVAQFARGEPLSAAAVMSFVSVGLITFARVVVFASIDYPLLNAVFGFPLTALLWIYILLRSTWRVGIRRRVQWRGRSYDAGQTKFGGE